MAMLYITELDSFFNSSTVTTTLWQIATDSNFTNIIDELELTDVIDKYKTFSSFYNNLINNYIRDYDTVYCRVKAIGLDGESNWYNLIEDKRKIVYVFGNKDFNNEDPVYTSKGNKKIDEIIYYGHNGDIETHYIYPTPNRVVRTRDIFKIQDIDFIDSRFGNDFNKWIYIDLEYDINPKIVKNLAKVIDNDIIRVETYDINDNIQTSIIKRTIENISDIKYIEIKFSIESIFCKGYIKLFDKIRIEDRATYLSILDNDSNVELLTVDKNNDKNYIGVVIDNNKIKNITDKRMVVLNTDLDMNNYDIEIGFDKDFINSVGEYVEIDYIKGYNNIEIYEG